jgi:hypothetical protein
MTAGIVTIELIRPLLAEPVPISAASPAATNGVAPLKEPVAKDRS